MFKEIVFYFLVYAFLGWCAEVVYAALTRGEFVNRGYLNGPYCPIYGFGVIFVLLSLFDLRHNKILLFFGSILITTVLEFLVGWFLEKAFNQRFWDYSSEPLNIKGYVCPRFSIMWGVGCVFVVDYLHVSIQNIYGFIPELVTSIFIIIAGGSILIDTVISTNSILKLNRELKALHEISHRLREISDDIGENLAKTSIGIQKDAEDGKAKLEVLGVEQKTLLEKKRVEIDRNIRRRRRMLKASPSWIHREFQKELEELKERFRDQ